jgi:3-hydroxyisobutyrate dehydrogenase-like beta-hydroxyacid dehydrogenase
MRQKQPLIGFIGQGFIGKNMADDFESRGYRVDRSTSSAGRKIQNRPLNPCRLSNARTRSIERVFIISR